MKAETIFQGSFWLLGFTVAFFAFVARERRTPSVANTMYVAILTVFFAALVAIIAGALEPYFPEIAKWGIRGAGVLLTLGLVLIIERVWRVHHRHVNFRDDEILEYSWIGRKIKNWRRERKFRKEGRDYRHKTTGITKNLLESIVASRFIDGASLRRAAKRYEGTDGTDLSLSIGCRATSLVDADELLLDLAVRFLENRECSVQYASCVRHPIEFLMQLKRKWNEDPARQTWNEVNARIVAVDAYTSHFGFTDSVHAVFNHKAAVDSMTLVPSPPTYAGVHTASMTAFKKIQKRAEKLGQEVRTATLVIYECPYALADLESAEQYRIFLRHVLPSERLWGGMLTVFVEAGAPKDALDTLRAYVDSYIDLDEIKPNERFAELKPELTQEAKP